MAVSKKTKNILAELTFATHDPFGILKQYQNPIRKRIGLKPKKQGGKPAMGR